MASSLLDGIARIPPVHIRNVCSVTFKLSASSLRVIPARARSASMFFSGYIFSPSLTLYHNSVSFRVTRAQKNFCWVLNFKQRNHLIDFITAENAFFHLSIERFRRDADSFCYACLRHIALGNDAAQFVSLDHFCITSFSIFLGYFEYSTRKVTCQDIFFLTCNFFVI